MFGPPPGETSRAIVLILPGFAGDYQVSMAYTGEVAEKDVRTDLSVLARDTHWKIRNVKITTLSSAIPHAKRTTTASFVVGGLASPREGWLQVEPFVNALKRYKWIEIAYLQAPEMRYRGIKDFENEFVKIMLSVKGRLYRFTVEVKDSGFDRLDLPLVAEEEKTGGGLAQGPRIAIILAVALLGGIIVYLIARKRQYGH